MKRRQILGSFAALPLVHALPSMAAAPSVLVYKNPYCGCCSGWVFSKYPESKEAANENR